MTPLYERYADLRTRYRPVNRTLDYIHTNRIAPDAEPGSLDGKSPLLAELYPNIADYRTISTDRYYDKDIMQREWDKMWTKVWLFAGLQTDLKEVGDWLTYEIGKHSIVVVRTAPDQIKAFYNVCRHRGNAIVVGDFGKGYKCFECSFHSWRWKLDGKSIRVTDRDTFAPEALATVDGEGLDLAEVHAEIFGGLVFVSFARDPMPLEIYLAGMGPVLKSYRIEEMQVLRDVQLVLPANWKLAINAFQEAYHVHSQHPQATLRGDDIDVQFDFFENGHSRLIQPQGVVSHRRADRNHMNQPLADMLTDAGLNPDDFEGRTSDARLAIREIKRQPDNIFNIDYSHMTDSQVTDIWSGQVFPNVSFTTQAEAFSLQRFHPHPTDPELTIWNIIQVGRKTRAPRRLEVDPAVFEGKRPQRKRTTVEETGLYEVLDQDVETIPMVQKGVRSPSMKFIRLGEQEARLQQMYAELDRYLVEA